MPPSSVIKNMAKSSLKEKWPQAIGIGALLLSILCIHVVLLQIVALLLEGVVGENYASLIAIATVVILGQFFCMPILYGALRWFWYTSRESDLPISEIFFYLANGKSYLRALSLSFRVFVRIMCVLFLCYIPSITVIILRSPKTYELFDSSMPYWVESFWILGSLLNLLGFVASFFLLLRYFAAPILMINDNAVSPQEALHLSVIISKNANGKTLGFILSFFAWYLLSLLYLPLIFTLPYFLCAYAVYCRSLINNYNNSLGNFNNTGFSGYADNL